MGRKVKAILTACILALLGGYAGNAQAAAISTPYIAEQASGKAPNIEVYMTGSKMGTGSVVSGTMGGVSFTQSGDTVTFEESGEAISYIILMDNSGSVNEEQFEEVKNQLRALRKSLKEGDQMALYTVGTNDSQGEKTEVFTRTVSAQDDEQKGDCKQIKAIEYMKSADSKTVLYRSLNQVLKEEGSPTVRTVVIIITDGEDDSEGKDIDNVSTVETVQEASVPVYGILLNRKTSKSGNAGEQTEKISYTKNEILAEKNCRGYYQDCSVDATAESVAEAFQTIDTILREETYVVSLTAPTNQALGKSTLELTVDGTAVEGISVDYSSYEEDTDPPALVGNVEVVSANSITFAIRDENGVNTSDVNESANYLVQTCAEDGDGKIWSIESVSTVANGNEIAVTLTMAETFYNDTYTLRCSNIRDTSQDQNEMDAEAEFTVENGLNARSEALRATLTAWWWIGLVVLVLIIGIIIIVVVQRKKAGTAGIAPEELEKADSKKVRLTITDRAGMIKDVEWDVEGSLFVGRSQEICNIFFDDDRLSKQHFAVEVNKMGCYIMDLESTNGTFVNGVRITNRRMLLDGDVITAGRERIVFHLPKQPEGESMEMKD